MGKVDFHSMGKVWENKNIPELSVSQIFWVKLKLIQFQKHGKSGFPFQIHGFLKYFGLSRNP